MSKDYYDILGISRNATEKEIKSAYRKLAIKYHPDKNVGDADAEAKFKEVAQAYETLSDPDARAYYDRFGQQGAARQAAGGFGGGGGAGFGFEDIFNAYARSASGFGDAGFGGSGFRSRSRSKAERGADIHKKISISFKEAYFGVEKDLVVPLFKECSHCHGSGAEPGTSPVSCQDCGGAGTIGISLGFAVIRQTCPTCQGAGKSGKTPCSECRGNAFIESEHTIQVDIPAGVDDDTRLKRSGQGKPGVNGGTAGDMYIDVIIEPDPIFKRDGLNIQSTIDISLVQAVLGSKVDVPTVEGHVTMTIPPGTQPQTKMRLADKGFPKIYSSNRGDHLVTIRVVIPQNLTDEEEEAFRAFAGLHGELVKSVPEPSIFEKVGSFFKKLFD